MLWNILWEKAKSLYWLKLKSTAWLKARPLLWRKNSFRTLVTIPLHLYLVQERFQISDLLLAGFPSAKLDDLYLKASGILGHSDCLHDCKLVFSFHVSDCLLFFSQGRWKIAVDYSWYKPPYALQQTKCQKPPGIYLEFPVHSEFIFIIFNLTWK